MHTQAPEVKDIAHRAFPGYAGNKYKVEPFRGPMRLDSYWSGGGRSYYSVVSMVADSGMAIPENGTPFSNGGQIEQITELPANLALVEHSPIAASPDVLKELESLRTRVKRLEQICLWVQSDDLAYGRVMPSTLAVINEEMNIP